MPIFAFILYEFCMWDVLIWFFYFVVAGNTVVSIAATAVMFLSAMPIFAFILYGLSMWDVLIWFFYFVVAGRKNISNAVH